MRSEGDILQQLQVESSLHAFRHAQKVKLIIPASRTSCAQDSQLKGPANIHPQELLNRAVPIPTYYHRPLDLKSEVNEGRQNLGVDFAGEARRALEVQADKSKVQTRSSNGHGYVPASIQAEMGAEFSAQVASDQDTYAPENPFLSRVPREGEELISGRSN